MHVSQNNSSKSRQALAPFRAGSLAAFRSQALRIAGLAALALMLLTQPMSGFVPAVPISEALGNAGAPASQFFAATNRSVSGAFLDTYRRYGLQSIGYPLSEERQENGRTVQYFERVRMELHPEAAAVGFPVMFSRLGDDMSKPAQPFARVAAFASGPSRAYFAQTGHSLAQPFLTFWQKSGGLALYGYPISEQIRQDGMLVQWFERARFEYHPDLVAKGQAVQLSLLGWVAYSRTVGQAPQPAKSAPQAQQSQAAPQAARVSTNSIKTAAPKAQVPQVALNAMEGYLLNAINEQRAAAGLGAVQPDQGLIEVARSRSSDMASRNYFSHTTPEGAQFFSMVSARGIAYSYAGEILARNNYSDAQAAQVAMQSYLNSPPHKAIMLDGRYTGVGIGYAKSDKDGMHYFTVLFIQQ